MSQIIICESKCVFCAHNLKAFHLEGGSNLEAFISNLERRQAFGQWFGGLWFSWLWFSRLWFSWLWFSCLWFSWLWFSCLWFSCLWFSWLWFSCLWFSCLWFSCLRFGCCSEVFSAIGTRVVLLGPAQYARPAEGVLARQLDPLSRRFFLKRAMRTSAACSEMMVVPGR